MGISIAQWTYCFVVHFVSSLISNWVNFEKLKGPASLHGLAFYWQVHSGMPDDKTCPTHIKHIKILRKLNCLELTQSSRLYLLMFSNCYVSRHWHIQMIQSIKLDSELPRQGAFDSEFKTSLLKHAYVKISYVISDLCDVTQSSLMLYLFPPPGSGNTPSCFSSLPNLT